MANPVAQLIRRGTVLGAITCFFGLIYLIWHKTFGGFGFSKSGLKALIAPFYFSFTTRSTVGYGDFSPSTPGAKLLVMGHQLALIAEFLNIVTGSDVANNAMNVAANAVKIN